MTCPMCGGGRGGGGGPEFWRTGTGKRFFEATLPGMIRAVTQLAESVQGLADEVRENRQEGANEPDGS